MKGIQNGDTGSRVPPILLNWWILPIVGASAMEGLPWIPRLLSTRLPRLPSNPSTPSTPSSSTKSHNQTAVYVGPQFCYIKTTNSFIKDHCGLGRTTLIANVY